MNNNTLESQGVNICTSNEILNEHHPESPYKNAEMSNNTKAQLIAIRQEDQSQK